LYIKKKDVSTILLSLRKAPDQLRRTGELKNQMPNGATDDEDRWEGGKLKEAKKKNLHKKSLCVTE